MLFVFLFKQKTAYEMRISDWSSDVCSSDLWYKKVRIKSEESRAVRTLLAARSRLVMVRRDLQNHIRSMLAEIGLRFPRAVGRAFTSRVRDLTQDRKSVV